MNSVKSLKVAGMRQSWPGQKLDWGFLVALNVFFYAMGFLLEQNYFLESVAIKELNSQWRFFFFCCFLASARNLGRDFTGGTKAIPGTIYPLVSVSPKVEFGPQAYLVKILYLDAISMWDIKIRASMNWEKHIQFFFLFSISFC